MLITAEVKAEISDNEAKDIAVEYLRKHFIYHDTYYINKGEIWWRDYSSSHYAEDEFVREATPIDRALKRILNALRET